MYILLGVLGGIVLLWVVMELISVAVYGWYLKDSEINDYLEKWLPKAGLNPYSPGGTLFCDIPKYIASHQTVMSKWHISDYGMIPRWSKWTKRIDQRRRELLPTLPNKEPLSNL